VDKALRRVHAGHISRISRARLHCLPLSFHVSREVMHACERQNAQERDTPGATGAAGVLRYGSGVLRAIRTAHHAPRRAERHEKSP